MSARGFLLCWCDSCAIQESFVVFLHILEVQGWILCKSFEIVQSQP